jgi:hypothetical protein
MIATSASYRASFEGFARQALGRHDATRPGRYGAASI